jgi:hypothetical protein
MAACPRVLSRCRNTMQVALLIAALAALIAVFASCGGSGTASKAESHAAERVAVKWLKEMADSNIKAACRLTTAYGHQHFPEHPNWSSAKACQEMWLHSDHTPVNWKPKRGVISVWGDSDPKVLNVFIEGDRAVVWVKGIAQGRPVWLRQQHGHWLVKEVEYPI